MKKLLIATLLLLTACDPRPDSCDWEKNWRTNQSLRSELFDKCLVRAAEARKGENYTTNDDEDYDEVISECGTQSYLMSRYCITEKK